MSRGALRRALGKARRPWRRARGPRQDTLEALAELLEIYPSVKIVQEPGSAVILAYRDLQAGFTLEHHAFKKAFRILFEDQTERRYEINESLGINPDVFILFWEPINFKIISTLIQFNACFSQGMITVELDLERASPGVLKWAFKSLCHLDPSAIAHYRRDMERKLRPKIALNIKHGYLLAAFMQISVLAPDRRPPLLKIAKRALEAAYLSSVFARVTHPEALELNGREVHAAHARGAKLSDEDFLGLVKTISLSYPQERLIQRLAGCSPEALPAGLIALLHPKFEPSPSDLEFIWRRVRGLRSASSASRIYRAYLALTQKHLEALSLRFMLQVTVSAPEAMLEEAAGLIEAWRRTRPEDPLLELKALLPRLPADRREILTRALRRALPPEVDPLQGGLCFDPSAGDGGLSLTDRPGALSTTPAGADPEAP